MDPITTPIVKPVNIDKLTIDAVVLFLLKKKYDKKKRIPPKAFDDELATIYTEMNFASPESFFECFETFADLVKQSLNKDNLVRLNEAVKYKFLSLNEAGKTRDVEIFTFDPDTGFEINFGDHIVAQFNGAVAERSRRKAFCLFWHIRKRKCMMSVPADYKSQLAEFVSFCKLSGFPPDRGNEEHEYKFNDRIMYPLGFKLKEGYPLCPMSVTLS